MPDTSNFTSEVHPASVPVQGDWSPKRNPTPEPSDVHETHGEFLERTQFFAPSVELAAPSSYEPDGASPVDSYKPQNPPSLHKENRLQAIADRYFPDDPGHDEDSIHARMRRVLLEIGQIL